MNGLKGLGMRVLDVKALSPLVANEGLKVLGMKVLDVKGFKPTGGE